MIEVFISNAYHNASNTLYPARMKAENAEQLERLVGFDHVFIEFREGERSIENFVSAGCLVLDCDNDHSENEEDWLTLRNLTKEFGSVSFAVYTSRNHEKLKGSKSPRPRFHVVFPLDRRVTSPEAYTALLRRVQGYMPLFDQNAMDAARFFFGNRESIAYFHKGIMDIVEFLDEDERFGGEKAVPLGKVSASADERGFADRQQYDTVEYLPANTQNPLSQASPDSSPKGAPNFQLSTFNSQLTWDPPVPFDSPNLPPFPLEALPEGARPFVEALSESTQTPPDMCACSALAALALCVQGKYRIQGKPDWTEPLNLYVAAIAQPSERKSAVLSAVVSPLTEYEAEENRRLAPLIERSKMERSSLEHERKMIEAKAAKGKATQEEIMDVADRIARFCELRPLKLYTDDITPEKLTSALSETGKSALLSAEAGIFDMMSGMYSKSVNIDVYLKAYSGDTIRVDRVGRASESIKSPALTILLMAQPQVIAGIMRNRVFSGRGLTARFLYCMPRSLVGKRKFGSIPMNPEAKAAYEELVRELLDEEVPRGEPELITLSNEARALLEEFSDTLETKLRAEYSDIAEWAGKLAGNVLRFAGIITRAEQGSACEFFGSERLRVTADTMKRAIALGEYFAAHAAAAHGLMGADENLENAKYLLELVKSKGWERFTKRDVMQYTKRFKKSIDMSPALGFLIDRGYLRVERELYGKNNIKETFTLNPIALN